MLSYSLFSLSLSLFPFARYSQTKKNTTTELEDEGQGVLERDFRHSTGNIQWLLFLILAIWQHTLTQNAHTAKDWGADYRQNLHSRFA